MIGSSVRYLLLAVHSDVEIAGEAPTAAEADDLLARVQPDLLFLDIQLPGRDGFGFLAGLDHAPNVIFCTAYSEFAVRAFERNALDYLMKPVDPESLSALPLPKTAPLPLPPCSPLPKP